MTAAHDEVIRSISGDRLLAHQFLFRHRHPKASPPFHREIIRAWHDTTKPRVVTEAFRGGGKSTIAEEWFIIRALLREFRNGLIIGANEDRAMERLEAIKHELETNEAIAELFGNVKGAVWTGHKIALSNGTIIQALGRGQSVRGTKHHDQRPDCCLIDDFEDDDTVENERVIRRGLRWITKTLLPALQRDPVPLVRFIGNRLAPNAVIVQLANEPSWHDQRFPVYHRDVDTGELASSWPELFPLDGDEGVLADRARAERLGELTEWNQEWLCEAEAEGEKTFRASLLSRCVVARVRAWEATYAMFDPARSVNKRSAATGHATWSYVGPKIVVWDGWQRMLMPNQIVDEIFACDRAFRPVAIGVERDGLNEFIFQPLRAEQVKRAHTLPVRPMAAPTGKLDFIRGMQPYFTAGDIEFAQDLPELKQSLLAFPTGRIDAANALAFFMRMKPGSPIYDDFQRYHVVDHVLAGPATQLRLCVNSRGGCTAAALVAFDGSLKVIADWVVEGDPGQALPDISKLARLVVARPLTLVAPPAHFDRWTNVGLVAAAKRAALGVDRGGEIGAGRAEVREMLRRQVRGQGALQIAHAARWTLNGFAGGFCRDTGKSGQLEDQPAENAYRVLIEAIESFAALLVLSEPDEQPGNYAVTGDGRRYLSAMARR